MAGQYTRMDYDPEAYKESVSRSTNPLLYKLDLNSNVNCNRCFAPYSRVGGLQGADVVGYQTDVDSILRGVTKLNSKSNMQQIPDSLDRYDLYAYKDCCNQMESENTRFTYPAFDIRGLTVPDLHFDYPLQDPQCQIFEPFAINTKLWAKDTHRTVWQIPMDQRDAMPVERLGRVKTYAPGTAVVPRPCF
jgi:hypothetical protein